MAELHNTARQRLAQPAAATPHPDANLLTAFAEGGLRGAERDHVLTHLSACADCREIVMLAQPEEEAAAVAETAPARTWSSWYRLRWGAVAASFVVIAAAVLLYREGNSNSAFRPTASQPAISAEEKIATKEQTPPPPAQPAPTDRAKKSASPVAPAKDELTLSQTKPKQKPPAASPAVSGVVAANKPNTGGGNAIGGLSDANIARTGPGYAGNITPPPPTTSAEVNTEGTTVQTETTDTAKTAKRAERADRDTLSTPTTTNDKLSATKTDQYQHSALPAAPTTDAKLARMRPAAPHWQWRANNAGTVERSTDSKHWQAVPLSSGTHFVAVVSAGSEVWAGGTGGALYRSTDDGAHWNRVALGSTADVKGLTLTAPNHVLVTTSEGTQPVSEPQQ